VLALSTGLDDCVVFILGHGLVGKLWEIEQRGGRGVGVTFKNTSIDQHNQQKGLRGRVGGVGLAPRQAAIE
jgi:hypothetical protein